MSRWARRSKPPEGFAVVEPTLDALREELRQRSEAPVAGRSKAEALWHVHQLNWQATRFVFDLHYEYGAISKRVLDYCAQHKLVDAALMRQWRRPGYEKLCSTFVINPSNYAQGTVSRCRVPRKPGQPDTYRDHTTGCRGCASGPDGFSNIFGNKYGQRLAAIHVARESRPGDERLGSPTSPWVSEEVAASLGAGEDLAPPPPPPLPAAAKQGGDDTAKNDDAEDKVDGGGEEDDEEEGPRPPPPQPLAAKKEETQLADRAEENDDDEGPRPPPAHTPPSKAAERDEDEDEEGPRPAKRAAASADSADDGKRARTN